MYKLAYTERFKKTFVLVLNICYKNVNHRVTKFHFKVVDFIDKKMI